MSIFKRTQRKYVKKAYRVRNWREYEAGLRNRGSLTVWISLTAGKLVNWDAPRPVLPPLSVGEMTLRPYAALNYSQNSAHDLGRALNGT